jgi:hypothetical protein
MLQGTVVRCGQQAERGDKWLKYILRHKLEYYTFYSLVFCFYLTADVAYWWEYLHTTQEVAGSIPAQCKHLCVHTCLFVFGGLGVSM